METSTLQETVEQHYKKHKPVLEWADVRKKADYMAQNRKDFPSGVSLKYQLDTLKREKKPHILLHYAALLLIAYETLPIGANAEDEKRVREGYRLVCDLTTAKPGYFRYAGSV